MLVGFIVLVIAAIIMFTFLRRTDVTSEDGKGSIYQFKLRSLDEQLVDFARYEGKNMLIVNTASNCRYTDQYKELEQLHEKYGDKIAVLGFPANDFLWQEPGDNNEIAAFCRENYGVKFQMFEKISVKGRNKHPLYRWLEAKSGKSPSWNFCKYLINPQGEVVSFYPAKVSPLDQQILSHLQPL